MIARLFFLCSETSFIYLKRKSEPSRYRVDGAHFSAAGLQRVGKGMAGNNGNQMGMLNGSVDDLAPLMPHAKNQSVKTPFSLTLQPAHSGLFRM